MAYGNGRFVTVVNARFPAMEMFAHVSEDGLNWETVTIYEDNLRFVDFFGFVNGKFLLTTQKGGATAAYVSDDGLTWTLTGPSGSGIVNSVAYGNDRYVAVGGGAGMMNARTSPDGVTWTSHNAGTIDYMSGVTFGDGLFVAFQPLGNAPRIRYSTDGAVWTDAVVTGVEVEYSIAQFVYGNGAWVAIGRPSATFEGVSAALILHSADGRNWTAVGDDLESDVFQYAAYGDGLFVVPASRPAMPRVPGSSRQRPKTVIFSSANGIDWMEEELELTEGPFGMVYGDGRWIITISGTVRIGLFAGDFGDGSSELAYPWLGGYASVGGDWIYHPEHGYLYTYDAGAGAVFLWDLSLGWIYTSESLYPNLYRYDPAGWLYYYPGGVPEGRYFYDYATGGSFLVP